MEWGRIFASHASDRANGRAEKGVQAQKGKNDPFGKGAWDLNSKEAITRTRLGRGLKGLDSM